jgi:tRNA C32,U32 (ribose-2'-O)-methylase TrmJ
MKTITLTEREAEALERAIGALVALDKRAIDCDLTERLSGVGLFVSTSDCESTNTLSTLIDTIDDVRLSDVLDKLRRPVRRAVASEAA